MKYTRNGGVAQGLSKTSIIGLAVAFALTLVVSVFSFVGATHSETVVVSGDTAAGENEPGWLFNRDLRTKTPFEFNTDEKTIGNGSLYVMPITNTYDETTFGDCSSTLGWDQAGCDKFIAEYFYLSSADDFESFSYDFKIAGTGTPADANEFYLNVYTNLNGTDVDNFYQCRFDFTPSVGSTSSFETFTVEDDTTPTHVQARGGATCPATIGELELGSTIRAFAIQLGDTSTSDTDLAGYFDNVVLNVDGHTTVFDFEPAKVDVCHQNKRGNYNLINISRNAVEKHVEKHGDGIAGQFPFTENCERWELMETVEVPGGDGDGISSDAALDEDEDYLLRAEGTYRFANWGGDFGLADAEFSNRLDQYTPVGEPAGWIAGEGYFASECGLDVQVDGVCVDWGAFNPDHVYELPYTGTGSPVSFHIYDNNYSDNSGEITVGIYQAVH